MTAHHMSAHFPTGGPPFQCPQEGCPFLGDRLSRVLSHHATHAEEASRRCPEPGCPFATRTKSRLEQHRLQHDKRHPCPDCGKRFASGSALRKHRQGVHGKEESASAAKRDDGDGVLRCPLCPGFATRYRNHLSLHMRRHSGTAHRCDRPGCDYQTPKLSLLEAHRRAHDGDKPFKCDQCDRAFCEK